MEHKFSSVFFCCLLCLSRLVFIPLFVIFIFRRFSTVKLNKKNLFINSLTEHLATLLLLTLHMQRNSTHHIQSKYLSSLSTTFYHLPSNCSDSVSVKLTHLMNQWNHRRFDELSQVPNKFSTIFSRYWVDVCEVECHSKSQADCRLEYQGLISTFAFRFHEPVGTSRNQPFIRKDSEKYPRDQARSHESDACEVRLFLLRSEDLVRLKSRLENTPVTTSCI